MRIKSFSTSIQYYTKFTSQIPLVHQLQVPISNHSSLQYQKFASINQWSQQVNSKIGNTKTFFANQYNVQYYSKDNGQDKYFDEETMVKLNNQKTGTEIILVGTAHVSNKSAQQVKEVIQAVRPQVIMIELCRARAEKLKNNEDTNPLLSTFQRLQNQFSSGQMPDINAIGAEVFRFGLNSFYAVFKLFGLEPGKEFKVALEEGQKIGADIIYGDQDIDQIMIRIRDLTNIQELIAAVRSQQVSDPELEQAFPKGTNSLEQMIESLKNKKTAKILQRQMERISPGLVQALITERNEFMFNALKGIEAKKIVAVVGLGHLDGIEQLWLEEQKTQNQQQQGSQPQ